MMTFVLISWFIRSAAVPILQHVVLVNFSYIFLFFIIIFNGVPRNGFSIFRGNGYVVCLPSRGPRVLLYAHLPQSEFCK